MYNWLLLLFVLINFGAKFPILSHRTYLEPIPTIAFSLRLLSNVRTRKVFFAIFSPKHTYFIKIYAFISLINHSKIFLKNLRVSKEHMHKSSTVSDINLFYFRIVSEIKLNLKEISLSHSLKLRIKPQRKQVKNIFLTLFTFFSKKWWKVILKKKGTAQELIWPRNRSRSIFRLT